MFADSGIAFMNCLGAHEDAAYMFLPMMFLLQGGVWTTSARLPASSDEIKPGDPGGHHGVDPAIILYPGPSSSETRVQPGLQS